MAPLQLQAGDDREQVGVAAALAVAVRGALHVQRAAGHGHHGVGHRARRVVVEVHADPHAGRDPRRHLGDHPGRVVGQRAAVGVAQRERVGARRDRGVEHGLRVAGVGAVAVEEVLGVEHDPAPGGRHVRHRVGHHGQVLFPGRAQRLVDVQRPRLADQGHDRRLRGQQRGQVRVVVHAAARHAGGAERGELGVLQVQLAHPGEELGVLRVGPRPPALDDVNAERIERHRDPQLVGHGEVEADLLRAVAQRGVVDLYLVHRAPAFASRASRSASSQPDVVAGAPAPSTADTAASRSAAASVSPR